MVEREQQRVQGTLFDSIDELVPVAPPHKLANKPRKASHPSQRRSTPTDATCPLFDIRAHSLSSTTKGSTGELPERRVRFVSNHREVGKAAADEILKALRTPYMQAVLSSRGFKKTATTEQALLLVARGVSNLEQLSSFLDHSLATVPRVRGGVPELKGGAELQRTLLKNAVLGKKLAYFCDYDVDGITTGAQLVKWSNWFNATLNYHKEQVRNTDELIESLTSDLPFVSDLLEDLSAELEGCSLEQLGNFEFTLITAQRFAHGFGLHSDAVDTVVSSGVDFILVGDCGVPKPELLKALSIGGVSTGLIDHHHIDGAVPEGVIVVNPVQADCNFADNKLSTSGLMGVILRDLCSDSFGKELLGLAGLGCYCDVMPIEPPVQALVHHTISWLKETPPLGISLLFERLGIDPKDITPDDLGYTTGPFINAIGRMTDDAQSAVDFLTSTDPDEVEPLVEAIVQSNKDRKQLERELLTYSLENFNLTGAAIVDSFDQVEQFKGRPVKGVVGIVSAWLARKFSKPVFLFGADSDGYISGSGRSPTGFHLFKALQAIDRQLPLKGWGGHQAAAGSKIKSSQVAAFRKKLVGLVNQEACTPTEVELQYDVSLSLSELNVTKYRELHAPITPWGPQRPAPTVVVEKVLVEDVRVANDYNLVVRLRQGNDRRIARWFKEAPYWKADPKHPLQIGSFVDVLGTLHVEQGENRPVTKLYLDDAKRTGEPEWHIEEVAQRAEREQKMRSKLLPYRLIKAPILVEPSQSIESEEPLAIHDLEVPAHVRTRVQKRLEQDRENKAVVERLKELGFESLSRSIHGLDDTGERVERTIKPAKISRSKKHSVGMVVTRSDGVTVEVPETVNAFAKSYPNPLIRFDAVGYRKIQLQELCLVEEEMAGQGPAHFIWQARVNTGKTSMALRALARKLVEGKRAVFVSPDKELAEQVRKEALRFLYLNESDIAVFTGGDSREERDKFFSDDARLYIVTPGAFLNSLRFTQKQLPVFHAEVYDEAHDIVGKKSVCDLKSFLADRRPQDALVIAMSGTLDRKPDSKELDPKLASFRDEHFPKALIRKIVGEALAVEVREQKLKIDPSWVSLVDVLEQKMLPLVDEIHYLLSGIEVPTEVLRDLAEVEPEHSRLIKRVQGKRKIKFDWVEYYDQTVRFSRDGTLNIYSSSALNGFMKDFSTAFGLYQKDPTFDRDILQRLSHANKWLLCLYRLNNYIDLLVGSELYCFAEKWSEHFWKYKNPDDSTGKPRHYERLIFQDNDIQTAVKAVLAGTMYERIFDSGVQELDREFDLFDASEAHMRDVYLRRAREDLLDKVATGVISNGPKTEALLNLVNDSVLINPRSKAIVFTNLARTTEFLRDFLNRRISDLEVIRYVSEAKLSSAEREYQAREFDRLKSKNNRVRVVVGTDALEKGKHVEDVDTAVFFNADPRSEQSVQKAGRIRRYPGLCYVFSSSPGGSDEGMAGACLNNLRMMTEQ